MVSNVYTVLHGHISYSKWHTPQISANLTNRLSDRPHTLKLYTLAQHTYMQHAGEKLNQKKESTCTEVRRQCEWTNTDHNLVAGARV